MGFSHPVDMAMASVALLLVAVAAAAALHRSQKAVIVVSFILAATASFGALVAGAMTVASGLSAQRTLPLGLPDLPFHISLDPLSGFFMVVVGLLSFFVSIYSIGYVRGFLGKRSVTSLAIYYCAFIAGMLMVLLADDALIFLISWEVMAAASYFLVMFENERTENRKAALLYLVMAHVGAISILLSFGVLAGLATGAEGFDGYTFDAMRQASHGSLWASVAFLLALFGFGAKAGVVPLHVWLPEAHPVAPSNVSALMSGVMLKTAVYGIVRVAFDLIAVFPWWWGVVVLALGLVSSLMGVLYALMQHDLKKLLAYHSVENIGIILIGIGLSMVFHSHHMPLLAALALVAGLYHTLNHAIFKGLLFMGAGAILHATGQRNMEDMGGLIHRMPWTSAMFLIGCISIAALPPFNGFVSEWLTFQAFLLSPSLESSLMKLLMPLGAAILALTGALAAACFVKVFGVIFLGHWRGHSHPAAVHEVDITMRAAMGMAALSCLALGILPPVFIGWMDVLPGQLVGGTLLHASEAGGWLWLSPISSERASYSGMIVFSVILSVVMASYIILHVKPGNIRRVNIWDCGFEKLSPRMQYNSTSFAMPLRTVFGFLFRIKESWRLVNQQSHPAFPKRMNYHLKIRDRLWGWIYQPILTSSFWVSRQCGRLQRGSINTYLIYSFITIIVLLVFAR